MTHKTILIPLLALAACSRPAPVADHAVSSHPPTEAHTHTADTSAPSPAYPLLLSASVVADQSRLTRIVTPVDGRVEELRVQVGDHIVPHAKVALVRGSGAADLIIALRQAESDHAIAQRELATKEALLRDGIASERETLEARERLQVASATLSQLQATAASNGLSEGASATISAPTGGTVLRKAVADGQYVQAGDLLLEVADLRKVWVMADVYESDISRVREGRAAEVRTLAWPDEVRHGHIDKVYSALDPESKTMKVRITLDNPDHHLLPGMFATVALPE